MNKPLPPTKEEYRGHSAVVTYRQQLKQWQDKDDSKWRADRMVKQLQAVGFFD